MGKHLKITLLAAVLSVLFLLNSFSVLALESSVPDGAPGITAPAPPEQEAETAATAEELLAWLNDRNASGTLTLTADITLADAQVLRSFGDGVTVDAGNYSITITGEVQLLCENLTITGTGGADGLLRVQPGGMLELKYLKNVTAADGGTALSQAEGAGLLVGGECTIAGDVQYAQTPFIWYWNKSPLVVVGAAETAQLPETVSAQVNKQGKMERCDVPVLWALDEHEQAQAQRRRFYAKGSADGYMMAVSPVCTVAYDDFPLTFTNVTAKEQSWCYSVTGGFTKPEAALPITVAEEYSFDGADWTTFYERIVENDYDGFSIELQKDAEEEPCWDTAASPYLYIRLRWNNGTDDYFSNVLRFAAADFGQAEDIGGNRGGGTDLGDPSLPPTGEGDDNNDTAPDEPPLGGGNEDGDSNPGMPQEPEQPAEPSVPEAPPVTETPSPTQPPAAPSASLPPSRQGKDTSAISVGQAEMPTVSAEPTPTEPPTVTPPKETDDGALQALAEVKPRTEAPMPKKVSPTAKAVAQTVAGVVAVGGVVVLAVTWSPTAGWGKRLLTILRKLFHR